MVLPRIGELNRRAALFRIKSVPVGEFELDNQREAIGEYWCKVEVVGASAYLESTNTETTLTHRIYLRYVEGVTSPLALQHLTEVDVDGFTYAVRRITDANSARRFTLLDCEQIRAIEPEG